MPSGVDRPLDARATRAGLAGLVLEQVDRVRRVMPEQVIGPAAGLAQRIQVLAAKEEGLNVHLLDLQLTRADALMDPLMGRVEAPGMAGHRDAATTLGEIRQTLGVGQIVGHWDLDHDVLARLQAQHRLGGVDRSRGGEYGGFDARLSQRFAEIQRPVGDAEALGGRASRFRHAAGKADHIDAGNVRHRFKVFDAERAFPGEDHLHGYISFAADLKPACPN